MNSTLAVTFDPPHLIELDANFTLNRTMDDYIYNRLYIRVIFITLYTVVFCLCVFGNLLVILVVTLSRRLRPITNFFLANLAVADFCVGIFCVYQNLSMYLISSWILGDFLCKMYYFINTLSYTASIFILVVICTERYFAIIYPITCKQILTPRRLRMVILGVWLTSAIYSSPKFFWYNTITITLEGGNENQTLCVNDRTKSNTEVFDIINFVLLYVIPLALMSLLYTRIAVRLWKSSTQLEKQLNASNTISYQGLTRSLSCRQKQQLETKVSNGESKQSMHAAAQQSFLPNPNSSQNVLRARRGVIRMLIIVVLAFALCNLPLHARKMWQYWSANYKGYTNFNAIFTPLTFLVTYFNSGINPLLYAFLSRNFRRGMREILLCSILNKRRPSMKNHQFTMKGMQRQASTRSTMKNATTVTMLNNDPSSECSHEV